DAEFLVRVHTPDFPAAVEVDTVECALGAESVNASPGDGGGGARSFVETKIVAVACRIVVQPDGLASSRIERLANFLGASAMEKDQSRLRHNRRAESLPDILLPYDCRTALRPPRGQIIPGINAVARRAQKLGPVLGEGAAGGEGEYGESMLHRLDSLIVRKTGAVRFTISREGSGTHQHAAPRTATTAARPLNIRS